MRATAAESGPCADYRRATAAKTTKHRPGRWFLRIVCVAVAVLFCLVAFRTYQRLSLERRIAAARDALRSFEPKKAIKLLEPVIQQYPECAEAEFLLAAARRRSGKLDGLDVHLKRAAELGWDPDEIDRQVCLAYFQTGDFRRAGAEMLDRMQHGGSDDEAEETYEAMARGYMATMLLKQAAFIVESWLAWRPQSVQGWLTLADVAALGGDTDGEMDCYRKAVAADPSNVEARRCLAHALILSHELEESHELLVNCLRDEPQNPAVLTNMGEWHQRSGQVEEAKLVLNRVLALQPEDRQRAMALGVLGRIALAEKDYAEAVRVLKEAVDVAPSAFENVYALSQALSHAGRTEEAKVYLARWQRSQEADKKLAELHDDILKDPEDPDLRTEIAQALLDQEATDIGVNWLLSVVRYHPTHPLANRLLAEHYEREGKTDLAARYRAIAEGKIKPSSVSSQPAVPAATIAPGAASAGAVSATAREGE